MMSHIKSLSDVQVLKIYYWLGNIAKNFYTPRNLAKVRLIIALLIETGVRVGELVLLETEYFSIMSESDSYLTLPAKITKTKRERTVPLSAIAYKYHVEYGHFITKTFPTIRSGFLFPSSVAKGHISTRQIHRIVRFTGKCAIQQEIHPHLLRHTFATRMMRVTSTRVVQELLGHQKLSSTQIYTHPNAQDLRSAIDLGSPKS